MVKTPLPYFRGCLLERIGLSNGSILDCTDMKSFLKKLVKYCTFRDLNFNVLAPQTINNRCENFLYFKCVFYD